MPGPFAGNVNLYHTYQMIGVLKDTYDTEAGHPNDSTLAKPVFSFLRTILRYTSSTDLLPRQDNEPCFPR